jgi:carbonic anhydrase
MPSRGNVALALALAFGGRSTTEAVSVAQEGKWSILDLFKRSESHAQISAAKKQQLRKKLAEIDGDGQSWDYSDYGLDWKMGQCCVGNTQSPVNISETSTVEAENDESLFFSAPVHKQPLHLSNTGKTLMATFPAGSGWIGLGTSATDLRKVYNLLHFEMHSPSEHTFGGERVALELQLYYRRVDVADELFPPGESLAVVSFGFKSSTEKYSRFLNAIRAGGLPFEHGVKKSVNEASELDLGGIFGNSGFWQYTGSMTTPPCNIGVQWFVRDIPLPASAEQIEDFRLALIGGRTKHLFSQFFHKGNARGFQPTCDRTKVLRLPQDSHLPADLFVKNKDKVEAPVTLKSTTSKTPEPLKAEEEDDEGKVAGMLTAETKLKLYEACTNELDRSKRDLKAAIKTRDVECKGLEVAKKEFEADKQDYLIKMRASLKFTSQRQLCDGQKKVVSALQREVSVHQTRCKSLEPSIKLVSNSTSEQGTSTTN